MLSQLPGCADDRFFMFVCAYCGFESPGPWASRRREHEEHVKTCPNHPLRNAEFEIAALEKKLRQSRRHIGLLRLAIFPIVEAQPQIVGTNESKFTCVSDHLKNGNDMRHVFVDWTHAGDPSHFRIRDLKLLERVYSMPEG